MTTKPKGVMIVGMEMPKNCHECGFRRCFLYDFFCGAVLLEDNKGRVVIKDLYKRPSWCPLQEVQ